MTLPAISLDDLELTVRSYNVLIALGCQDSRDITNLSARELLRAPRFGKTSLADVRDALARFGLYLAGEEPPVKEPVMSESSETHMLAILAADEPLLQFFTYGHLPQQLQPISRQFTELACWIVKNLPRNPERTVAIRKLLEAKDCAIRAYIWK